MRKPGNPYLCPLSPFHLNQSYNRRNTLHVDTELDADSAHTLLLLRDPHIDFVPQLLAQDAFADESLIVRERPLWAILIVAEASQVIGFTRNMMLQGRAWAIEPFEHLPAEFCLGGRRDRELAREGL